jgi:hypothetical protein
MNSLRANTSLVGNSYCYLATKEPTSGNVLTKQASSITQPRSSSTNASKMGKSDVKFPALSNTRGEPNKRLPTDTRLDYFEVVTKNCYTVQAANNSVLPGHRQQ